MSNKQRGNKMNENNIDITILKRALANVKSDRLKNVSLQILIWGVGTFFAMVVSVLISNAVFGWEPVASTWEKLLSILLTYGGVGLIGLGTRGMRRKFTKLGKEKQRLKGMIKKELGAR